MTCNIPRIWFIHLLSQTHDVELLRSYFEHLTCAESDGKVDRDAKKRQTFPLNRVTQRVDRLYAPLRASGRGRETSRERREQLAASSGREWGKRGSGRWRWAVRQAPAGGGGWLDTIISISSPTFCCDQSRSHLLLSPGGETCSPRGDRAEPAVSEVKQKSKVRRCDDKIAQINASHPQAYSHMLRLWVILIASKYYWYS